MNTFHLFPMHAQIYRIDKTLPLPKYETPGSFGFDFHGTYTQVEPMKVIEAMMLDRALLVEFTETADGVLVRETFDAEEENAVEMQKAGWQAILDNFKRHTEA